MNSKTEISPVARIYNDFTEKFGIPRQSGKVPSVESKIVFEREYRNPDALRGIEGFSHLWLIFDFSKAHREGWSPTVRPPRLGGNERVGVFASRSPFRPNNLGLSSVKLLRVEQTANEGSVLIVSGADILSGTPLYDIKPYLPYTDIHADAVGGYADEALSHKLEVNFPSKLLSLLPSDKHNAICELLAEDPRPSYQNDGRVYSMAFGKWDVKFTVEDDCATVIDVVVR